MDLILGEVIVWYQATGTLTGGDVEALGAVLSADERQRASRFVFERDRRDFIAAHALVRHALSNYGPTLPNAWRFDMSAAGKPSVTGTQAGAPPLSFNLSHTDGLVACAFVRGAAVGVDVERLDRPTESEAIASRYFTPSECLFVSAAGEGESRRRFVDLWTLKEAYLKGTGSGIAGGLRSCEFAFPDEHGLQFVAPSGDETGDWQFVLAEPHDGYRLAVAIAGGRGHSSGAWRVSLRSVSPQAARAFPLRWSRAVTFT